MECPDCRGLGKILHRGVIDLSYVDDYDEEDGYEHEPIWSLFLYFEICERCWGHGVLKLSAYSMDRHPNQTTLPFSFDGGECPAKWEACGMPKGAVPDQFVKSCSMGGKNLHIYRLGFYDECKACCKAANCRGYANCAGEQAEW
jgi:hypothetical protein